MSVRWSAEWCVKMFQMPDNLFRLPINKNVLSTLVILIIIL